ncbi:hypothetical protein BG004_008432 [Podila humilis]|nr:hypothetical protein BG004_008432 [Podila humilis]
MTSALDMSLDDIIKTQKASRPRKTAAANANKNTKNTKNTRTTKATNNTRARGGARNSGPTRNTRQSRDKKPYNAGVQQYRAAPAAPLHTSVIRQNAPDGSKMQVSNLDHRVTAEDLKLVFDTRVGPLKKCTLMYDQSGKSTGVAVVHFKRVGDSAVAYQKFNGVPLDGRAMKIEIVGAPVAQIAAPKQTERAAASNNQGQRARGTARVPARGATRPARGARNGRPTRNGARKPAPKTTAQLDAEMNDYMQVDA